MPLDLGAPTRTYRHGNLYQLSQRQPELGPQLQHARGRDARAHRADHRQPGLPRGGPLGHGIQLLPPAPGRILVLRRGGRPERGGAGAPPANTLGHAARSYWPEPTECRPLDRAAGMSADATTAGLPPATPPRRARIRLTTSQKPFASGRAETPAGCLATAVPGRVGASCPRARDATWGAVSHPGSGSKKRLYVNH